MTKTNIRKFLDVSTGNLSEATRHALEDCNTPLTAVYSFDYGWWIYVQPDALNMELAPYPDLRACST